jgi:predicted Zn finger-like uncharacterized protein
LNIRCHGCGRAFRVRQERLPASGARTRCPRCHALIVVPPAGAPVHGPTASAAARQGAGEIFEIPPAELILEQEDLFDLGGSRGESEAIHDRSPRTDAHGPPGSEQTAGSGAAASSPLPAHRRRSGFLGWLARLFGGAA